jgi:tRNA A-37 threonylcarbamoyl transferase component Bud32
MTELPASFGKYFLTEKLATGGMAEIYLGKLLGPGGFEKQLVIKQIHPRLAAEKHFVDLFVAEAKTLVGLTHGNIVPVYELGLVDDTYFIAMEYIDGPTLWTLTESVWRADVSIEPALAAWIAAEILDGLDYAHRKGEGVIHRDLSPRNVMLSRDGQVLLVDFGIAVPFGAGDDPEAEGAPTGSFPYMSPEQVERRRLTTASDLFSVSVLLWEMLAGRRLFARAEPQATLDAVLHAEIPPPSSVRPGVPAKLDEVVLRGLERDPEKRWPRAGDLLAAINRYLYALDEPPGSRDLSALIARHCPPITHELEAPGRGTLVDEQHEGPATIRVERPAAREEIFATHADIQQAMQHTPLFGVRALKEVERSGGSEVGRFPREETKAEIRVRTSWLPLAGISTVAIAVVAGSLWLLLTAPDPDAPVPVRDASEIAVVRIPDAARPPPDAARPVDAGARPIDAAPSPPDAAPHVRVHPDAGVRVVRTVDAAVAAAMGAIKVGADPWGEVLIDGKKVGNAPGTFSVRAGHHNVIVVFPGDGGEQRKPFAVDV